MFPQAFAEHKNGHYHKAAAAYRTVLANDPNNANALHLLGLIEFEHKNYDPAILLVEKSLALVPNNVTWLLNYGEILTEMGRSESSASTYRKALSIDPRCLVAQVALADLVLEVEPTTRCNLGCNKCSHGANHRYARQDEMTRQDWEHNLLHFLPEDELVITGGEPTLYNDLEYIIDTWVGKFDKPVLRITSNGHNWRRWLPLQDRISNFYFSHYPDRNDAEISVIKESGLKNVRIISMPETNLWDVWYAPKDFTIFEEALESIKTRHGCTLVETKAVSKRRIWSCCVGGFFYRRINGLPPFYGSIEIGSPDWRERLKKRTTCPELCRYCFLVPRSKRAQGEHIPTSRRK